SVPSRSLWSSARPQVGQSSPGGETEERGMNRDGEGYMAVMRKERLRAISFTHKSTGSLSGPAIYPPYHTPHTHTHTHIHTLAVPPVGGNTHYFIMQINDMNMHQY